VVAASVGGLRTAVDDGASGLLVPGHDPVDYADAIARLLDDDLVRHSLGRGALAHAQQFGWSATAGRMMQVYAKAMAHVSHAGTDARLA
jgi:D-inositol-3-phosphate glycosyltransferase